MGVLELGFLSNFKILLVGFLLYVIIYSLLKKVNVLGNKENVNALVAIITVILISFSGVLTYVVTYAINWFAILIFLFFLIFVLLTFIGVNLGDIHSLFSKNSKVILIIFLVLFSIIFLKGFFALNNTFDVNHPQNNSYVVNTSFNSGVDDVVPENSGNFLENINIDQDVLASVLFLIVIGIFVLII